MDNLSHPFKKPRLDSLVGVQQPCSSRNHPSEGICDSNQDDFWGQDDFTAEEFDYLQSQVDTQALTQVIQGSALERIENGFLRHDQEKPECSQKPQDRKDNQVIQLQEQQFAQEGQIKMLKSSLEAISKELDRERLLREDLLQQRIQQYKNQETKLQKRVQQVQTELQFKEQEVRAANEKILHLEQKMKESLSVVPNNLNSKNISPRISPKKFSPNKFMNRFSFPNSCQKITAGSDAGVQTEGMFGNEPSQNTYLNVCCSKGLVTGPALVSKTLCNQMSCVSPLLQSNRSQVHMNRIEQPFFMTVSGLSNNFSSNHQFSATKLYLARLNMSRSVRTSPEADIFPHLENCLQDYLKSLHVLASQGRTLSPSLNWSHSHTSSTRKDASNILSVQKSSTSDVNFHGLQEQALSALCDLVALLSMQSIMSLGIKDKVGKNCFFCKTESKHRELKEKETNHVAPAVANSISKVIDSEESLCRFQNLASLLVTLSNPLFSSNECVNQMVVQWSLLALMTLSSNTNVKLEPYLQQLNLRDFVSGICGLESAYLVLHLLYSLLPLQTPGMLLHNCSEPCVFNSLAQLCEQVHCHLRPQQASEMLIMVANFLSQILACHDISVLIDGQCGCSAEWLQAVISSLWKELQSYHKNQLNIQLETLKKGASLLAQLALQMDSFQECRRDVDHDYVNLVCGLAILCKKYDHLKELSEIAQELWDFGQDETGEFIVEETSLSEDMSFH